MSYFDLSVLIPARNEMFLNQTIDDILANRRGATEIIAVLDGGWPIDPIPDNERVTLIYHPEAIGQRAATNDAAKIARGYYVMKLDAHCAMDEGFDVKMLEAFMETGDDVTMVPLMRNLHVFDWVCPNGHRRYQGPSGPCKQCGEETERDIVWIAKQSPQSRSYCFDSEPHFQYFREFSNRPEGKGDLTETMSLQGSCWMLTRDKYFELNVCDEDWGTWGSQGIEVACKTWLSGGRCVVNQRTWYAHCFRTQGGDFGFPYSLSGKQVSHAKRKARELFFSDTWPQQTRPLSWLVEKFWPVQGWSEEDLAALKRPGRQLTAKMELSARATISPSSIDLLEEAPSEMEEEKIVPEPSKKYVVYLPLKPAKEIIYYTDNRLDSVIMNVCQRQLEKAGLPIISVSLKPLEFGENIVVTGERGPETMFRQILAGIEASSANYLFFAEHDVLYHPSHFEFWPERDDIFYYNNNVWKVDAKTGHALFHYSNHTSQLCAHRSLLLEHYAKRVALVAEHGFSNRMGFEPGTHGRKERVDDYGCETWMSEYPNIDIRHKQNLTPTRWKKAQFRNLRFTKGWMEAEAVAPWYTEGHWHEVLV